MIGMQDDNIESPPKKVKPDAGLEPATVGLKVQRSTDWANQALERYAGRGYSQIDVSRIAEGMEELESLDEDGFLPLFPFI